MSARMALILTFLIPILAASDTALAAPPSFATRIAAIEQAQTAELERIEAAIAEAADQAEVVVWQRCAAHVKLASRLALHETQLEQAVDVEVREQLTGLVRDLRARLDAQDRDLPRDYAFDPLAALTAEEVPPCAE